jgi:integrase
MPRSAGEGSITQRKDGRWFARLQISGHRYSVYGRTRKEAADKLQALQQQHVHGTLAEPSRMTVADHLQQWLDQARLTCKPTTIYGYEMVAKCHLVPELGTIKLQQLSPTHLIKLYQQKCRAGLSPRRVQIIHAVIHRALVEAVRWRLVLRNVADDVKPPRNDKQEPRVWDVVQVRRFMETAQTGSDRYAPALVLALALGLRASELFGLRWESVDSEKGIITVDRTLNWVDGKTLWGSPKSKAGRRVLPLPEPARLALLRLRQQQGQDRVRAGAGWQGTDGRIVTSAVGTAPTPNRLKDTLDRLCVRADVPRLTVHQLRHQCASLLFAAGADVKQVQHFLGHSRASVTLDVYTHLLGGADWDMARRLEQALE